MSDDCVMVGTASVQVRDIFAVNNDRSGTEVMVVVLRDHTVHRTSDVEQMKAIEDAFRAYKEA